MSDFFDQWEQWLRRVAPEPDRTDPRDSRNEQGDAIPSGGGPPTGAQEDSPDS